MRASEIRTADPEPRTLNPALSGLLLLQSYRDDAVTVAVGFPEGRAMMDVLTRERFVAGPDGNVRIPVAADYGVRLLAVGRGSADLPVAPESNDIVLGDFELGMPFDLDPHPHHSGLECSIVEDESQAGNHILRLKRPLLTAPGSPAQTLADAAISLRFRLPALPEKVGTGNVLNYAWRVAKPYPDTTQYGGGIWITRTPEGTYTWVLGKPQAVAGNQNRAFTAGVIDLTDKPLPGVKADTEWHTLAIETRGGRHVIRFDDQVVFEGSSNLVPAGGFSLAPAYDPYIEIDDLCIRRK